MNAQREDLGYRVDRPGNGANGSGLGTPPGLGGTPTGTAAPADASVGALLKELAHEVPALLRGEVNLAKAEARQSLHAAQQAAAADMELWLSALIVGTVALAVGMMMLQSAKKRLAEQSLVPRHTLDSLRRDKDALRGRTSP